MSEELKERIRVAITDEKTAQELIDLIASLQARVQALEDAP